MQAFTEEFKFKIVIVTHCFSTISFRFYSNLVSQTLNNYQPYSRQPSSLLPCLKFVVTLHCSVFKVQLRFKTEKREYHVYRRLRGLGGDKRNRTVDPLLAKQVLYQLSYTPE